MTINNKYSTHSPIYTGLRTIAPAIFAFVLMTQNCVEAGWAIGGQTQARSASLAARAAKRKSRSANRAVQSNGGKSRNKGGDETRTSQPAERREPQDKT